MNNTQPDTTQERLQEHVQHIADTISGGYANETNDEGEYLSAFDYLEGVLDIEYILNADKTFKSARLLVAFGGPNIWVNLQTGTVEGYWWNESAKASFNDDMGLEEAVEELFNC